MKGDKDISKPERDVLLGKLRERFNNNMGRHPNVTWEQVSIRLDAHPDKVWSLAQMENSGGEPDVIAIDQNTGAITFVDCAAESPAGRRSYCYDREALEARKEHKPANSAIDAATEMGIELLTEQEYAELQKFGKFDTKTSSWVKSPEDVRKHGGALFGDFRYGRVFFYHNGVQSYYAARGFRAKLVV